MKTGSVTSVCEQHIPLRDKRQKEARSLKEGPAVTWSKKTRDITNRQTSTSTGTREAMRVIRRNFTSGPVIPHGARGIIGRLTGRMRPIVVEGDWTSIPTYPVFRIYPER